MPSPHMPTECLLTHVLIAWEDLLIAALKASQLMLSKDHYHKINHWRNGQEAANCYLLVGFEVEADCMGHVEYKKLYTSKGGDKG